MIDFSSARISRLIVHRIGNKSRAEGWKMSENEAFVNESLSNLILQHYLVPTIRRGDVYEFHHESDLNLNVVNHYALMIFSDNHCFAEASASLGKHLYSASTHPNIVGGEFLSILFDDIRTPRGVEQGLGLYRVEGKSDYLDVEDEGNVIQVVERTGISLDRIQKGAIVLSSDRRVHAIDAMNTKTKYWLDTFLKVIPATSSRASTKMAGDFVKQITGKTEKPGDAISFGRKLLDSLTESDAPSMHDIKNIAAEYVGHKSVSSIIENISQGAGREIPDTAEFEKKAIRKYAKDACSRIRICDGISLVLSAKSALISDAEVVETDRGFRAIIDIDI